MGEFTFVTATAEFSPFLRNVAQTCHNLLASLAGQEIPIDIRPQLGVYSSREVAEAFWSDHALTDALTTQAAQLGFVFKLEWRSEPVALLREMGIEVPEHYPASERLYRPQPIYKPLQTAPTQGTTQ